MVPPVNWSVAIVPAAVVARMAAALAVGALPLGAFVPLRARAALAVALAVVALPRAAATPLLDPDPLIVASEAVVGAGLGLVAAVVCAAAAWAGGTVGSLAGLSWADDFGPDGEAQSAGLARLAAWLGIAGFFAAGGHLAVVVGLVDSFRIIPVGTAPAAVAAGAIGSLDAALALALALAGPALAAVVAYHVAATVCLRAIRFLPGQGMLQAAAAAVALAIVLAGLPTWLDGFGTVARNRVERSLAAAPTPFP